MNNTWILVANSCGSRKQSRLKGLGGTKEKKLGVLWKNMNGMKKAKANPNTKNWYRRRSTSESWSELDDELIASQLYKKLKLPIFC